MPALRSLSLKMPMLLLGLLIPVLGTSALIPAGYMLVPSGIHGFAVVPCPASNPLAHVTSNQTVDYAALGHSGMGHAAADRGEVEHAGMSHGSSSDSQPGSVPSRAKSDCAFGAFVLAGTLPNRPASLPVLRDLDAIEEPALVGLVPGAAVRLRPPPRAPPHRD